MRLLKVNNLALRLARTGVFASLLVALQAFAFNSEAWLGYRDALSAKAQDLREDYAVYAAKVVNPALSLTVPVENYPDGSIKTSIFAEKACFFMQDGYIWAEGVLVRDFAPDGSIQSQVEGERCLINRNAKTGWVEGHAKAFYKGQAEAEGDNVYLSMADEFIIVFENTVLKSDGRVLTGKRLDYDRHGGIAMMDGNVVVTGAEKNRPYEIKGEQVFAFFENTNDLKRVVAYNGVKVQSENRFGSADRAVYNRKQNKLTMYAGDKGPAILEEKGKRKSKVKGRVINFWLDAEQVEVQDSEITAETKGLKEDGRFNRK